MKFFRGKTPTPAQFESQQDKLRRLSGDVLRRYRQEIDAEISDPDRLAAAYGVGFASSDMRRQAKVVAEMATSMLGAPNAMVTVVGPDGQDAVAAQTASDLPTHLPLQESYCRNVIGTGRELSVANALEHPLVCDTHLALDGAIVSYLGVPVADRAGVIVGVLCVWDGEHERDWGTADVGMLTQLSAVLTRAMPAPQAAT